MNDQPTACPNCGSTEIHYRKTRGDWCCDTCDHKWSPSGSSASSADAAAAPRIRLFLSYGRHDAAPLAERIEADLAAHGYEVWRDTR
ncbi:MAG: hypothetical protein ACLQIB_00610 [Isosphaeraceae bacterium]